jgi:hypothetical protein
LALQYGRGRAGFKLAASAAGRFWGKSMKRLYSVLLILSLGPLALAQNKNTQDPTLRPHHSNAIKPVLKAPPVHKDPALAGHKAGGNAAGLAPAGKANSTDAQLNALEHQQATVHNPKPAPKAPAMAANANNRGDANRPINFTYKAPNANNAIVGGTANGRKIH